MYVDKNLFFIDTVGLRAGTAWSTLWAHTTSNISDTIDLEKTANRKIAEGGYVVFQVGTVPIQASGSSRFDIVCSAAAGLGTNTVLWSTGELAYTLVSAWVVNTIVFAPKLPMTIPLRYVGIQFYMTTASWTAGTLNVYITPTVPVPYSGYVI